VGAGGIDQLDLFAEENSSSSHSGDAGASLLLGQTSVFPESVIDLEQSVLVVVLLTPRDRVGENHRWTPLLRDSAGENDMNDARTFDETRAPIAWLVGDVHHGIDAFKTRTENGVLLCVNGDTCATTGVVT
jgi:hypothetical protein